MRLRLDSPVLPPGLSGTLIVDALGLPRYWALAWAAMEVSDIGESHLSKQLAAIDRLYHAVEARTGTDCLDRLLTNLDLDTLEPILEGFFIELRNRRYDAGTDPSGIWRAVVAFVRAVVNRIATSLGRRQFDELHARLLRLDNLYAQLRPGRRKRAVKIRALPAGVVEDLYGLIVPTSPRNPFRSLDNSYRNLALFLLMMHQGLRRGEVCILPVDAVKDGLDPRTGELRRWLDIVENPYERSDRRSSRPSLKTAHAIRQIPISDELVEVLDTYSINYRGKQDHSFLFSSQKNQPLALPSVNQIFDVLSQSLSPGAKAELRKRRHTEKITPHDLRHTAAVVRLTEFIDAGHSMQVSLDALKVFFGWSKESEMPRHYARAYFEDRLSTVWNTTFDTHIDHLRRLDKVLA